MRRRLLKKGREGKKSGDQAPLSHLNASDSWRMLESRHMRGMWRQWGRRRRRRRRKAGRMPVWLFGAVDFSCVLLRFVGGCTSCDQPACVTFKRGREIFFLGGRGGGAHGIVVEWRSLGRKGGTEKVGGRSSGKPFNHIRKMCLNMLNYSQRMIFVSGLVPFYFVKQMFPVLKPFNSLSLPFFPPLLFASQSLSPDPLLAVRSPGGAVVLI